VLLLLPRRLRQHWSGGWGSSLSGWVGGWPTLAECVLVVVVVVLVVVILADMHSEHVSNSDVCEGVDRLYVWVGGWVGGGGGGGGYAAAAVVQQALLTACAPQEGVCCLSN